MKITGDQRRRSRHSTSSAPPGRLTKGQELALFVVMMAVLIALIIYGLRA